LFGPNYRRFEEACQFVRRGGGFPVKDFGDLLGALRQLEDPEEYQRASAAVKRFLSENEGATEQIWRSLCAHLEQRPR
jgi:3-deoxy-D-manno-octulosonic-acid transferase